MLHRLLCTTATCLLVPAGVAVAGDWPAERHDVRRSGMTDETLDAPLVEAWRVASPTPSPAWPPPHFVLLDRMDFDYSPQPVVADGVVCFASNSDDSVRAVERAAQLADLQERVQRTERRLAEIDSELMSLGREQISQTEVVDALRAFDQLWNVLAPREQARLLELLIEQIQYDGENGRVSITFHPCGLRSLTDGFITSRKAAAS